MGTIASQSEGGITSEILDGQPFKDGETISIVWPDQYKEHHKVVIISQIVPSGRIDKAHIKINLHGLNAPVAIMHLASLGAELSRKPIW